MSSDLAANDTGATILPSIETPEPATNGSSLAGVKQTVIDSKLPHGQLTECPDASAAVNAVQNHPVTQSVANGPVATSVKDQSAKTSSEFSNLANSRTTPSQPTATGQPLTHYHSFFGTLLSWNNPRASGIAYLSTVLFIFAARYLNILRYAFKLTWMTLGVTVLAEVAGKTLFSAGFTSQFRPRKYYTVPKETLDMMLGDVHELINFFVIESQRIVFAENVAASVAAFFGSFLSYYLIKIVPLWGMALIGTSVLFLSPLIYKTNKELIDHHVENVSNIINQQTQQVKQLASHHAARATEFTKQSVGDYSAKAQEMVANARGRSTSPVATKSAPVKTEPAPAYKSDDFPAAPKEDFKSEAAPSLGEQEPLIAA
ncbi:reticulon-like protein [Coleophoma cylindrospora]|uniref:Reticulon-like protein n=1 Tax=Coleophoma cylindrospora TaxID=1849047 RepID=A0A3D8S079_9HELO|nr:reticulon-like protein [Coleophoma cylindrospora]